MALFAQGQLVPADAQLAQHPRQGGTPRALGHEVGQGVQAGVEQPAAALVKGIEPAPQVVALEHGHALPGKRQADARRQPGEAGADHQGVEAGHGVRCRRQGGGERSGRESPGGRLA